MRRLILITFLLCFAVGGASASIDAYDNNLVLLLHMNQTVGHPEYFNDSSVYHHTVYPYGGATTNTSVMFGTGIWGENGYFDGSNDRLNINSSDDFNISASSTQWTMAFIYNGTPSTNSDIDTIVHFNKSGGYSPIWISWDGSGKIVMSAASKGATSWDLGNAIVIASPSVRVPIQIVIRRNATHIAAFTSGVQAGAIATTANLYNTKELSIMGLEPGYSAEGNIEEFAFWKGVAIPISDLYPLPTEMNPYTSTAAYTAYDLKNPYSVATIGIYKGQLHAHTTNSDGVDTPTALATAYKNKGYSFLEIADHDHITPDPGVSGITHINGSEETVGASVAPGYNYILNVGASTQQSSTTAQEIIDGILVDNGMPMFAAPYYTYGQWTTPNMTAVNNISGIEMWNGVDMKPANGGKENAEDKWDYLLTLGNHTLGVAVDDCHDITASEFNTGWVQVFSNSNTQSGIISSIRSGNYYSSNGTEFNITKTYGNQIIVSTLNSSKIEWVTSSGYVSQTNASGTTAGYSIGGTEKYIRVRVTDGSTSKMAWSNPIYLDTLSELNSPSVIQFIDKSTNTPVSWMWNYTNVSGDNTPTTFSTLQNPEYVFSTGGNYSVTLLATNSLGSTMSASSWVNISSTATVAPVASFTCTPTTAMLGESIACTDTSSDTPTNWTYYWGDGNVTDGTQNPSYTYPFTGTFSINQTVNNTAGSSWFNRSNYITITNVSGFTQQDLWQTGHYTVTLKVTDSSNAPIPVVTVTDNFGQSYTTTNGTAYFTEDAGAVVFYFAATGYVSKSMSYIIDGDSTDTVQMVAVDPNQPVYNVYPPKDVKFHITSFFGTPIQNANVTIQGITTSTGNWDWLVTLLGISLDEVAINGTAMTESTDTNGDAVFLMLPSVKYNITTTASGYTFPTSFIAPQATEYTITANWNESWFSSGNDTLKDVNVSVSWVKKNDTYSFVNITYDDQTMTTTGGTITVYRDSVSRVANASAISTMDITSSSCSNSTLLETPTGGASYRVLVNATTTDQNIMRTFTHYFKGAPVTLPGWTSETLLWLALFIVIFTAAFAGAIHSPQMAIVLCVESWVFWAIGWLDALITQFWYGETAIIGVLALASFLAVMWNITEGKSKVKRSS